MKSKHFPRISTRGYYDLLTGKTLKKNHYYLYPAKYFARLNSDEIVIVIHGLRNNKTDAVSKFELVKRRLQKLSYRHPVIGFSYDSNTKGAGVKKTAEYALKIGQKIAEKNGKNLAQFIIDLKQKNSKIKIRLIGHSLGAQVIQSTIKKLYSRKKRNFIESIHFFGGSIPSNSLSIKTNGKFFQKIVSMKITNFYAPTDSVLKQSDITKYIKSPIGLYGVQTSTISKYVQKKVRPKNHRFASYVVTLKKFP